MWFRIIFAVGIILAGGAVYLAVCVSRFGAIRRLPHRWQRALVSLAAVAAVFLIISRVLSFVSAAIAALHVLAFFLLFGLLFRIIFRVTKKEPRICWQGWCALAVSLIYLSTAYYLCHHVWRTDYVLSTQKKVEPVRIAMFADSHVGTTFDGDGFAEHVETIKAQNPDIVVIAGDFIDDWSESDDIVRACAALGTIDVKYGVWYAYGNHDKGTYRKRAFSAEQLAAELEKNNVHILEDEVAYAGDLCIVGRRDGWSGQRMDLSELLEGVDTDKYIVVIDHEPADFENESKTAADLVLSGHTHGGYLFPFNGMGMLLGLDDLNYGREDRNGTTFLVTSGMSNWQMDFKTGTKSEYVMIEIQGQ